METSWAELRSGSMESGALSVMTLGHIMMLMWFAGVLDVLHQYCELQ